MSFLYINCHCHCVFSDINCHCVFSDMCSDETVTLSFFDSQAVAFHIQLEAMRVDPKVMVVTSINPKIVGGIGLCIII